MTTQAQREGFAKAVAAGVRLAYGTDSGVYPHGRNAIQFGYRSAWGSRRSRRSGRRPIVAAELMGWEDRVGSVAAGPVRRPRGVGARPAARTSRSCDGPAPSSRAACRSADVSERACRAALAASAAERDRGDARRRGAAADQAVPWAFAASARAAASAWRPAIRA